VNFWCKTILTEFWHLQIVIESLSFSKSSLLYIEVWKRRWSFDQSPMIFYLIWLLFCEGSISNPFKFRRNICAGRTVILVLQQRHKLSSGDSGCTFRTIVLCQRSSKNKHPMPSNLFELTVASLFWSSAMLDVLNNLWSFNSLIFWWTSTSGDLASDDVPLMNLLLMTSSLQEHLTSGALFFRCFKLPSSWFHYSHLFFQNLYFKETLNFCLWSCTLEQIYLIDIF